MSQQYDAIIIGAGTIEAGEEQDQSAVNFHLTYFEHKVSSGFYPRLCEVNKNSSFSVLG